MAAPAEQVPEVFVGREPEVGILRSALEQVRTGRPHAVLIEGAAGIGKTALLDHFLGLETDVQVLRASGEPWEALVSFGLVDQMVRSAGLTRTPIIAERERSLPMEEPVSVGARILDLLGELDRREPVILVVDDAPWADLDSLRALLFALRRLIADPVLTVLTARTEDADRLPEGLRRLCSGRTGRTLRIGALDTSDVQALANVLGLREFSPGAAHRLQAHTDGNPLYVRALLTEVPADRWRSWQSVLPAPRAFASRVQRRIDSCTAPARRLVEAAAVLGNRPPLSTAAVVARVDEPARACEEAAVVGLLRSNPPGDESTVAFAHPLIQAAVYGQMGLHQRNQLHLRAADVVDDAGAALRHRVAASHEPDARLASELEEYGRRQANMGGWARAAPALVEASHLSSDRALRETRLLLAVDAMVGAGDLGQAATFAREIMGFPASAMRDAALGYLAVVRGRSSEADHLLHRAWDRVDAGRERSVAATIAQRLALHGVGRLDAAGVVEWTRRAIELAEPYEPVRAEAQAVLGLGLAWQGRLADGLAGQEAALDEIPFPQESALPPRITMAHGWLLLADDDIIAARAELMETAPAALARGSIRISLWAYSWLALTDYLLGNWDEAVLDAERAVTLLGESGHAWLRPLVRWAATLVPAARGDWRSAEEHVRLAVAHTGDYELMTVGAALARARLASARGDNDVVLRTLEPLTRIRPTEAVDEPGFWPWRDMYADALATAGLLDEADAFLIPRETLAEERGRRLETARLARARGRLESARGNTEKAEAAFRHGLERLGPLPVPFERALLELAHGQTLRRNGKRRAAAVELQAASDRFATLEAQPYLERAERELVACGLTAPERRSFDPTRLTAQEHAVARLVADGLSNRAVAAELFVSVKTVQFHLTHVYTKLGLTSRAELAARLREDAS